MRTKGMIRFTAVVAVLALTAVACAAAPGDVGDDSRGEGSTSGETLDEACREFSTAWGQDNFDGAAAALQDMASAMAKNFPEEAALTTGVVAALADGDERALARLEPVIPILGSEACAAAQEIVSVYATAPAPDPERVAADLAEARKRWAEASITTYYYETSTHRGDNTADVFRCGFGGYLVVQVMDGAPSAARDKLSGCEVGLGDPERPPLTVEEWFDLIDSLLSNPAELRELHATFSDIGVPVEFFAASRSGDVEGGIRDLTEGVRDDQEAERILSDLKQAQALWEAAGVASYRFRVEVGCFCLEEYRGPFTVVVRNGAVEATRNGEPVAEFAPTGYFTVPGLFDAVERFAYSDAITVRYHPDFGFPVIIDADPVANAIDEELRILVTDFTING